MIYELELFVDCPRCGTTASCEIVAQLVRPEPVCGGGCCPHDHSEAEAEPCGTCGHVIDHGEAMRLAEAELDARGEEDMSYEYIND